MTNSESNMKILTSIGLFSVTLALFSAMASAAPPIPDPLQQKKAGPDEKEKVFQTHFLVPDKGTASGGLAGRDESGFHLEPVKARIGGYKIEGARSPVNVPDKRDAE
ncbi:hypothetical protein HDU89_001839 [Geranomyces variabilis]|nr:hypothetical protein HDU89_001839 [Geranomyces variabilis]